MLIVANSNHYGFVVTDMFMLLLLTLDIFCCLAQSLRIAFPFHCPALSLSLSKEIKDLKSVITECQDDRDIKEMGFVC